MWELWGFLAVVHVSLSTNSHLYVFNSANKNNNTQAMFLNSSKHFTALII